MSATSQLRDSPDHAVADRDVVRTELRDILSSVHFCNSKRYPAFLKYVVEQTLAGQGDMLKERTIGVEVFERQATYDTNSDGVVRFTAGEVRKRLAAYYHDSPHPSRLRITLPLGTYVPDFSVGREPSGGAEYNSREDSDVFEAPGLAPPNGRTIGPAITGTSAPPEISVADPGVGYTASSARLRMTTGRIVIPAAIALLMLSVAIGFWFFQRTNPLNLFWRPFLHDRGTVLVCAGGNTIPPSQSAGLITADKATAYPYFSLQTTVSVERLGTFIEHNGASSTFSFAASTPLPELHSHPIILVSAYNNQWTLRLVEPLRFHFSPDTGSIADQSIVDRDPAGTRWKRDPSLPESEADDYALIARFWDTVTDNWVLVLAGLGRNGTEAASQFVTSAHYAQLLRDRIGGGLEKKNIEVVLKVNVIDGKTGPPSIVATHVW